MDSSSLSNRLTNYGIHVDDLSRLRVLDENSGNHAHDLRVGHFPLNFCDKDIDLRGLGKTGHSRI